MRITGNSTNRIWVTFFLILFGTFFVTSCKGDFSTFHKELPEETTIEIAYQKWQWNRLSSYQIEQLIVCYCLPPAGRWIQLTVLENEITSAINLGNGEEISQELFDRLYTIEEVFELIQEFEASDPVKLEIEYDPKYGYPRNVDYDYSTSIADDEFILEMRSFKEKETP